MGATQQAMAVSLFVLIISMSITGVNTLLSQYYTDTGGKQLIGFTQTATINNSKIGASTTQAEQNVSANKITTFNPPPINSDVNLPNLNSGGTIGLLTQILYYSTWGLPDFLNQYFYMPDFFVYPMKMLIWLSHTLVLIYLTFGREF